MKRTRANWPLFCDHANEVPVQCRCPADCGCWRWGPCHAPARRPVTLVNVNRQIVARNHRTGQREPPIRVSRGRRGPPVYVSEYTAHGRIRVIYSPDRPLPCGARVWIEIEE